MNTLMNFRFLHSARNLLLCEELSASEEELRYTQFVSCVGLTENCCTVRVLSG